MSTDFEIPRFHYFRSGNPYSGSVKNFRFRMVPKEEELLLWAWPGPNCQDKTPEDQIITASFPLTEGGLKEATDWLINEEPDLRYHRYF